MKILVERYTLREIIVMLNQSDQISTKINEMCDFRVSFRLETKITEANLM